MVTFALYGPQQPEINDQFVSTATEETPDETIKTTDTTIIEQVTTTEVTAVKNENNGKAKHHRKYFDPYKQVTDIGTKPSFITTIFEVLTKPIVRFISSPKVNYVLKNVGTCLVNGAMEIIAYYFPAPLIPLIASAAGMVIPFEPVVMLKEKMPVTSYRRAFRKAMSSFLNTFEGYKPENYEDDPYMTRRFNRRFMNDVSTEEKKVK